MSRQARYIHFVLCLATAGLLLLHANASTAQIIYAAPNGNDHAAGTASAPVASVNRAIELARSTSEHIVELRGGDYRLSGALALTAADSGLTLRAHASDPVTISGGVRINGWKVANRERNLWSATFPAGLQAPRQIYVDGVRATRTSGRIPVALTMTRTGYIADSGLLGRLRRPEDLESVYTGGNAIWSEPSAGIGSWTEPRCPVASIHGTEIKMAEPCWTNSTQRVKLPNGGRTANLVGPASVGKAPIYMENAFELLGRPGEFYIDTSAHRIYYVPRHGENMEQAAVEAPVLTALLTMSGTSSAPVHDVTISGITFAYAAWFEPSGPEGFSEIQANYRVTGSDGASKQALCTLVPGGTCPFGAWTPEFANVTTHYADNVHFVRDTFTHLGGAGLAITGGAHHDLVQGCIFTDISGNGLQLAGVDQPEAPDADFAIGNHIENNLFRNVGTEFRGGIPIVVGYAQHTRIAHNQIDHVPYAAISIGWGGWPDKIQMAGVTNRSTGNVIEANNISHLMLKLSDGGGIYTQGRTGTSLADGEIVQNNVVADQFSSGHAIYTDNGSSMITVRSNVIFNTDMDNWGSRHKSYYDGANGDDNDPLAILDNWWQQGDVDSNEKQVVEKGNHLIDALSDAPAALLDDAGLEAGFRSLRVNVPTVAPEPPTAVSVLVNENTAYITWRPPVFEGESSVDHYTVRSTQGQQATISAADFDRMSFVKLALAAKSTSLNFTVTASNSVGESVPSLPSFAVSTPTPPMALPDEPQSVSVHVSGTRASIHFGAPKENSKGLIAYVLTVDPGTSRVLTGRRIVALEGKHTTFFTVSGLVPGKEYRFGVAAVNPSGQGPTAWADKVTIQP